MRKLGHALGRLETLAVKRHFQGEDVVCIEAGVDRMKSQESADEKPRANEQNEGQGHFAYDKQRAGPSLTRPGTGAAAACIHHGGQVSARRAKGGKESEQNAGKQR